MSEPREHSEVVTLPVSVYMKMAACYFGNGKRHPSAGVSESPKESPRDPQLESPVEPRTDDPLGVDFTHDGMQVPEEGYVQAVPQRVAHWEPRGAAKRWQEGDQEKAAVEGVNDAK